MSATMTDTPDLPAPYPFTRWIQYVVKTVRVSIFSVGSTVCAPLLLVFLTQGQEVLNAVTDKQLRPWDDHWEGFLHYVLFLAAFQAWGLANWYGSRVLLQRDFMAPRKDGDRAATKGAQYGWNIWFPRILAALGMTIIAAYILFVRKQLLAGSGAALSVAGFLLFTILRRKLFAVGESPATNRAALYTGERIALWLSISLSLVLLVTLTIVNWWVARFLGAPVVLFLALGSMVLFGAVVLTYLPLSYGLPGLVWLPVLAAFLLGTCGVNRNHAIAARLLDCVPQGCAHHPSATDDFANWVHQHKTGPIVLVAAEGGASRSAWWTSHVLGALDYATGGEFSNDVYAVSGVSGGSLGAATYVALLHERGLQPRAESQRALQFPNRQDCLDLRRSRSQFPLPMQSECFLGRDFLSTTLGYMLFPDLLQRILPLKLYSWDRSRGLEQSWQLDWNILFGRRGEANVFAETLEDLYALNNKERANLPILFLNSARAKAGRSVLQAPITVPSAELDDLFDERLNTHGLALSDAVHNSARFPLVSPGGDVEGTDDTHWDALVDGGYFENSGAATLAELIRVLHKCADQPEGACPLAKAEYEDALARIQVLFIMNDPDNPRSLFCKSNCSNPPLDPEKRINEEEVLTPVVGLFDSRGARGESSKRFLLTLLPDPKSQVTEVFLVPNTTDEDKPAMSWYLNDVSRAAMWKAVTAASNPSALCGLVGKVNQRYAHDCPAVIKQFAGP
jgi:hypothetical protein